MRDKQAKDADFKPLAFLPKFFRHPVRPPRPCLAQRRKTKSKSKDSCDFFGI